MSELKHTPGPWDIYPDSPATSVYCDDELGSRVADCDPGLPTILPMEQRIANAKLIAAAPDMLEALMNLRGIEAWIKDVKMKELFQRTVYPIIDKATK